MLGGGITNRNFKVSVDDAIYVLRVGGKDTELLGIDRRAEHEASLAAAAVGVGPEVVAFIEPEGFLVTRYIEGEVVVPETCCGSRSCSAASRRRCGRSTAGRRSRRASTLSASSRRTPQRRPRPGPPPAALERARETARLVERARGTVPERPCHNDLLTANFIDDGSRIRIVDWEYAGMGDVYFDLANFAVNNDLSDEDTAELLRAYFGAVTAEHERTLTLMRYMSDFREAMWGVVQQALSDLDFDFRSYAGRHFERLERTAAEIALAGAGPSAWGRGQPQPPPACASSETVATILRVVFIVT